MPVAPFRAAIMVGSTSTRARSMRTKARNSKVVAVRTAELQELYWTELDILLHEFIKLEERLSPEHEALAATGVPEHVLLPGQRALGRMRYFIENVQGTMNRMAPSPEDGVRPYDLHQVG